MTPVDLNLYKTANLPEEYERYGKTYRATKEAIEDSRLTIVETLENNDFNISKLKDIVEIPIYATNDLTWGDFIGDKYEEVKAQFPMLKYDTAETIVKVSDYNKLAKLYGNEQYSLNDDEYILHNEALLPELIKEKLDLGEIKLCNLISNSNWYGITYKEDLEGVKLAVRNMIEEGWYPNKLWKK